jgi:hypothetical protein
MYNCHQIEELARERQSEAHRLAARQRAATQVRREHPSLRVRTGWTLVGLGLKLAVPAQRRPVTPTAVRS